MIPRTPEPELMNDPLQVQAYAAADFAASDQALVECIEQLLQHSGERLGAGDCLVDLGCGPGNISERLARHWPTCQVVAVDAAPQMIAAAESNRRRAGIASERLRYVLSPLPWHGLQSRASLIVSNSLLHHLHDPQKLWSGLRLLAGRRCLVVHRDLRRPPSALALDQLCERYVADAPEVLQRDYRASLQAAFTLEEVRAQLRDAQLAHLQVRELEDRYLEIHGWITGCQAGLDQSSA